MIVLMGIILAVSVFAVSSIPTEISDLSVTVPKARSNSLLPEFIHLKETFGLALNYDFVSIEFIDTELDFQKHLCDVSETISESVTQTANQFYMIELQHDKIFNAEYKALRYSHLSTEGHVYHVDVRLSLKDGYTTIKQDVTYSIVCKEYI